MDKRYQVFVSSTYEDLQEERQQVMQALLELDCNPSGMELFPAANDDQWTLIKKVIDDCDYYIVIVGGRYGSLGPDGMGFTEMEYRYALERGKPIIAFLHKDPDTLPAKKTEQTPEGKKKLEAFRALAQQKMVKFWTSPADLGSVVSRSLIMLIKRSPAVGWVRADQVPDENTSLEILRLRKQVEELELKLTAARTTAPEGTQDLAQGDDEFVIRFKFLAETPGGMLLDAQQFDAKTTTSWKAIFATVSPLMIDEASDKEIETALNKHVEQVSAPLFSKEKVLQGKKLIRFEILDVDYHTIIVQLRSLGLITKSTKPRSLRDTTTRWTLTPYGDAVMTTLRAIRKGK